ncbi:MAG TPA: hypothetical protein VHS27_15325 [Gaiellales bacterium]|jgi:hypothetical protein|nr:hypothetical protein [Gaiellales bacterium]
MNHRTRNVVALILGVMVPVALDQLLGGVWLALGLVAGVTIGVLAVRLSHPERTRSQSPSA